MAAPLFACSERAEVAEPMGAAGASEHAVAGAAGAAGAEELAASVELGVPGGEDGLDFEPLEEGAVLKLQTFGQGGTHVIIGVRCTGFGNRTFISATLRNLTTDVTVAEPAPARPQLLFCGDGPEGACDLVPYLVHASGLTQSNVEKDGLRVLLTAQARNEAGRVAEGSREIVLSAEDL